MVMKNKKDISCEKCENPEAYEQKIKDVTEKGPGWYTHYITDDDITCPNNFNVHTHGFPEKYNHPDIQICIPMPPKQAHALIWGFLSALEEKRASIPTEDLTVASNWIFPTNVRVPNILGNNFDVMFLPAQENDREVYRMILPDPKNNFDTMPYKSQLEGVTYKP